MTYLWLAYLSLGLNLATSLLHLRALRVQRRRFDALPQPATWPDAALLIPVKGVSDPRLEENVRAALAQAYPGRLRVVFCFESEQDPAVALIERLTGQWKQASCCIAGLATTCGQKNHNILAAAAAHPADLYLIADADVLLPPRWAHDMALPLTADPSLSATTGYYYRAPTSPPGGVSDHLISIIAAWVSTGIARDDIPSFWGGSMALRPSLLRDPPCRDRLAAAVVDDMCLMEHFLKSNLKRAFVPTCIVPSYVQAAPKPLFAWSVRQAQYGQIHSRAIIPLMWLLLGTAALTLFAWPWALYSAATQAHTEPITLTAIAALPAGWWLVGACFWRSLPPHDPALPRLSLLRWLLLTPAAFAFTLPVLLGVALRTRRGVVTMRWRGITYRVARSTGRVLSIERT